MSPRTVRFNSKVLIVLLGLAAGAAGLAYRTAGLNRSLWLDEAWVANSAAAESLRGVFYYEFGLQISPPLFLLLVRACEQLAGTSNLALRIAPLLLGVVGLLFVGLAARETLSRWWGLLVWTLLALSPAAIEYSATLKHYSGEMAASGIVLLAAVRYLKRPEAGRFRVLTLAVLIALPLAYSTVFLLPGILGALLVRWPRRAVALGLSAGVIGASLYVLLVIPNNSPALKEFWEASGGSAWYDNAAVAPAVVWLRQLPLPAGLLDRSHLAGALALVLVLGAVTVVALRISAARLRRGRAELARLQLIFGTPCVVFALAHGAGVYPLSVRTSLFALPCFVLFLVLNLQLAARALLRRKVRWEKWAAALATGVVLACGIQRNELRRAPEEDAEGAVAYLRQNARQGDLVWVHWSCAETFRLYAGKDGLNGARVRQGRTGWACCPREMPSSRGRSTEEAVRTDLAEAKPFPKVVWLLYTGRGSHWTFVGLDEPRVMKDVLREAGCREEAAPRFVEMGLDRFECAGGW